MNETQLYADPYSLLKYNIIKHLKFIMKQMRIKKITKHFLINYYGLTYEESLIIIKMLHGALVSKQRIIEIAEKIFREDLLNLIVQHFYDVTLIIYLDDYKINLG
jgi:hypothetical protein